MPTYEYRCGSCRHHYEKREGFDAPSLQVCPACGAEARRVLHPPPIVFKGSGFYSTDSRKSRSTTIDGPAGAEKSETAAGGKDSAPAPKADQPLSPKADSPQARAEAAS